MPSVPEHIIQLAWVAEQAVFKATFGKPTSETYEHFKRYYGGSLQHIRTVLVAAALLDDQELYSNTVLEVEAEYNALRQPRIKTLRPLGDKASNTAAILSSLRL